MEEVTSDEQPATAESTETQQADTVETSAVADEQGAEKPKVESTGAKEQTVEELKESPPCVEELKNQEITTEKSAEIVTGVFVETEKPESVETSELEDQHTNGSKKHEEDAEIVQHKDSSKVASEVEAETQKVDTVVVSVPADQHAPEEPRKDERVEGQIGADVLTDEQPKDSQTGVEDVECDQKSDLPEVASEVTAEAEQGDAIAVESSNLPASVEHKEGSQQAAELQECLEETENKEQAASEEQTEEVKEVLVETQSAETVKTSVPVEKPTDDQECMEKMENSQQETHEELAELSVESQKAETAETLSLIHI